MLTGAASSGPLRGREIALLVAVSATLCAIVAAAQGLHENAFGNMGAIHLYEAEQVLAGRGFGRMYEGAFYPDLFARPTYTLLLAPFFGAIGRYWSVLRPTVAAAQGAMNAVAAVCVAGLLARAGAARAARVAAWGVVLHPVLVSQAASIVDTALFACALVAAWAAVSSLDDEAPNGRRLAAGAVLGLAVLTRSTALTLVPVLVLAVWRGHATLAARLRAATLVAVGACVVVAPWLVRNHALTDRWMLSTVDGVNLWMGNNPNTAKFLDEERSLDELPDRAPFDSATKLPIADQLGSCDAARSAAKDFIRAHSGEAAVLALRKAGDFWSVTPTPRTTRSTMRETKELVGAAWTIPLYALAAIGVVFAWRTGGALRTFARDVLVAAVLFTIPHALAWGGTRLRAPFDPFVVALAAVGAVAAIDRVQSSRGRDASQAAAANIRNGSSG